MTRSPTWSVISDQRVGEESAGRRRLRSAFAANDSTLLVRAVTLR